MLNIGLIIAGGVLVIYLILGPIVIMGFYAFFDRMAEKAGESELPEKNEAYRQKDPALWSSRDVRLHLRKYRHYRPD